MNTSKLKLIIQNRKRDLKWLWISVALATLVNVYAVIASPEHFEELYTAWIPYVMLLGVGVITWTLFIVSDFVIMWIRKRNHQKITGDVFYTGIVLITGIIFGTFSMVAIKYWIKDRPWDYQSVLPTLSIILAITIIVLLLSFFLNYRRSFRSLAIESAEYRFRALEARMQPHFLYNSLNSIAQVTKKDMGTEDCESVRMTFLLAKLYRQILDHSEKVTVSLSEELDLIEKYLSLEKIRFGDRLNYSILCDDDSKNIMCPALLLQTLVENAVKHGIEPSIDGGHVTLEVKRHGDITRIEICNTGVTLDPYFTYGYGLKNTITRLDTLYDDAHEFRISKDNGKTIVQFNVPSMHGNKMEVTHV